MWVALTQNVVNVALSAGLVFGAGWRIEGVATGTLVAQWTGCALAATLALRRYRRLRLQADGRRIERVTWRRYFSVGRDIFFRTLCLVSVMFSFTIFGARLGETVLAANAILMQFFLFVSYFMDGFAYAGEALGGRFLGSGERGAFRVLHRALFVWGIAMAGLFTLFFALAGEGAIGMLTNVEAVRQGAVRLLPVAIAVPFISIATFIYDGLFIGITATREMFLSTAVGTLGYFALTALCADLPLMPPACWLWAAFLLYLALRGSVQACLLPRIVRRKFPEG